MAKLIVQLLKYIGIVLAAVVCIGVLGCGVLVIFPSASIFGVSYSSGTKQVAIARYSTDANFAAAQTVEFKTNNYGIFLRERITEDYVTDSQYGIGLHKMFSGFVYGDIKQPSLKTTYNAATQTLTHELTEPVGLVNSTNTYLDVFINKNLFSGSKLLKFTTNGGTVNVGYTLPDKNPDTLNLRNVLVKTGSGSTNFYNAVINGNLTVDKTGGSITVQKDIGGDADIKMSGITKIKLANVNGATRGLTIDADNANIEFGNVNKGFFFEGNGGLVKAGNINGAVSVETNGAEIRINKINNTGASSIIDGTDGSLTIGEVSGLITVKQTSGSVNITKALDKVNATTTRGNITIGEANAEVNLVSERGNITVNCNASKSFKIKTENKYGTTTIKGARSIVEASIKDNGSGKLNIEFLAVSGLSTIMANTGSITITIPKTPTPIFYLTWSVKSANIAVGSVITTNATGAEGVGASGVPADYSARIAVTSNGSLSMTQLVA